MIDQKELGVRYMTPQQGVYEKPHREVRALVAVEDLGGVAVAGHSGEPLREVILSAPDGPQEIPVMEATLVGQENLRDPIVTKVHFLRVVGVKLQENAKRWMPASTV